MALTLMKGSEAIAEAAIRAGARRMPEVGGCFLQAESEVAAINMVYGAAGTGARVITSSSSPGVSLKQEGISYCAGAQLPCVILNVMPGNQGRRQRRLPPADLRTLLRPGSHRHHDVCL